MSDYAQPSVAKDKPAGSGLPKPIRLFFSLLPAGLLALARRFELLWCKHESDKKGVE
jgi:hypothetical protein